MILMAKILFMAMLGISASGPSYGADRLLSDLDIPLMPGFMEDDDSRVVFDTPAGRIIEVRAAGFPKGQKVLDYYQPVLSSLAWARLPQQSETCSSASVLCVIARRDGEILTLKIEEKKPPSAKTFIYFSVNPE